MESMRNPASKMNQKSTSFKTLIEAEKKRASEATLDEPSTQRPARTNFAPSNSPTRTFLHQVGPEGASPLKAGAGRSFSNVHVRFTPSTKDIDFYNITEVSESEA
jgi:hypothetical protein